MNRCLLFGWVVLALPLLVGCPSASAPSSAAKKKGDDKSANTLSATQQTAEDVLSSALHQLQPENLGIDSDLEAAISVLNSWKGLAEKTRPAGLKPPEADWSKVPAELVAEDVRTRINSTRYDAMDGRHIRGCLLANAIAKKAGAPADSDLGRATLLFDYTVRNVALQADDEVPLPLTPYEILIVGRGTPSDRAWIFASLLKQWQIDALVLRPIANNDPQAWLVGVPLEGQVYLFDARLGLIVPNPEADANSPLFRTPATLGQIQEHPDWLNQLAPADDQPYPLTADDLSDPLIELIAEPQYWSERMWLLEQSLPGDSVCLLYDPLAGSPENPGFLGRIQAVPALNRPKDWRMWTYPYRQFLGMSQMDQLTTQAMRSAMLAFVVPIEVDPETNQATPTNRQLGNRTDQLLGRLEEATAKYLVIRQLGVRLDPDASINQLNQLAAEDAFYWTAICKYEQGQFDGTIETLEGYFKRYRRGKWIAAASQLLALSQVAKNDFAAAIQTLKSTDSNDPNADTNAVLLKHWSSLAK